MDALLTVGQVAATFGVTVRTLHHYDEVGLLTPSERSPAGYRLYTGEDLERLATIVTYRRLGLALDDVRSLLNGDGSSIEHLRRQRDAVMGKVDEMHRLIDAIDARLEREMTERPATTQQLKEIFGDGFTDEYQVEAEERWGETDAWKQSAARTSRYTPADWERVKAETDAVNGHVRRRPEVHEDVRGHRTGGRGIREGRDPRERRPARLTSFAPHAGTWRVRRVGFHPDPSPSLR